MKYEPPYGPPGTIPADASYINGDPSIGRQGSVPPAAAFENPQREIVNLITNAQQVPTDQDLNQMTRAIRDGKLIYCLDSGPLNTLEIASLSPPITSYQQGLTLHVLVGHTNTGPTTITIGNLNATAVHRRDGAELAASDIVAGQICTLVCDGTFFQLQNMGADGGVGGSPTVHQVDIPYVHDTGAVDPAYVPPTTANPNPPQPTFTNHVVGLYSPLLPNINEGRTVEVKLNQTIYGPTDFAPNNFPVHPVAHPDGSPIVAGDGIPNQIWLLVFDGVEWQLLDVFNVGPVAPPSGPPGPKVITGRSLQFQAPGTLWTQTALDSQPSLRRTPSMNTNTRVWCVSMFLKFPVAPAHVYLYPSSDPNADCLISAGDASAWWGGGAGNATLIYLNAGTVGGNCVTMFWDNSYGQVSGTGDPESYTGVDNGYFINGVFADTKWHHFLWAADGAHLSAYYDGGLVSQGSVSGNSTWNSTWRHVIGADSDYLGQYYGCHARYAEIIGIDGQCLDSSKFYTNNNGILVPIDQTAVAQLPFGPNGFYLNWQNAVDCTPTGLGKDMSQNGNNWQPLNFSLTQVQNDFPGAQQS